MTRQGSEGGFTLVELLVTVVIMTIIVVGITSGLIVVLKTYPSDAMRLTQDEGSQLLSSWLQADVVSASTLDNSASTCAGGATKLRLKWSDSDGAHKFEASYILTVPSGSPVGILTRYYCVDDGPASVTTVGRNVQTATAHVSGQQVSFVVTDLVCPPTPGCPGGSTYTFTVSASGRTPPTTTSTSTTSTSTTSTSTTTTTMLTTTTTAPACTITSANVNPPSGSDALSGSGHVKDNVTLTVITTGVCSPLTYSVDTGNGVLTNPLAQCSSCAPPGTTWTGFIDKTAQDVNWKAGFRPFSVFQGTPAALVPGSPNPVPFTVTP